MPENEYYTGNKIWAIVVWDKGFDLKLAGHEMKIVGASSTRLAAEQAADALNKNHPDKSLEFGVLNSWLGETYASDDTG